MNKRIEELAEQVYFTKDKYGLYWDENANTDGVDLEKFAELIIREHLSLLTDCYRGTDNAREWDNALLFLEKHIKEHFGVE